jgi:hypothetical protein
MGDYNYPDINWLTHDCSTGVSVSSRQFLECIGNNFLTQHVDIPTREASTLDLLFTSDPDLIMMLRVLVTWAVVII